MYARTTSIPRTDARISQVLLVAFFSALTAFGAQVAIRLPFSPVPITLQVLMVIASGLVLGSKRGFMSQVAYLSAGVVGLPVFAGGTSGVAALIGPTGGYLVAFPVAAFVAGWLGEKLSGNRLGSFAASLAALAVIYCGGTLWLAVWLTGISSHTPAAGLTNAWRLGVRPFIAIDLAKAVLAAGAIRGGNSILKWFGGAA
jgi:biotin transport system substrate-specific component